MKKSTKILIGFFAAVLALAFILPPVLLQKNNNYKFSINDSIDGEIVEEVVASEPDSIACDADSIW